MNLKMENVLVVNQFREFGDKFELKRTLEILLNALNLEKKWKQVKK